MLERLLNLLTRYRWTTVTLGMLLFAAMAWFIPTLSVNDSPERWFPQSTVDSWKRYADHYEYGDSVIIGIQFDRPLRDDDIEIVRDLRQTLSGVDGVTSVTDISLIADVVEKASLTTLTALPQPGQPDPYQIYRGALFDDPTIWRTGDSDDPGRTLLMIVELSDEFDINEQKEQLDNQRRSVAHAIFTAVEAHEGDDITFHVAGPIIIQYELERIARRLVLFLLPCALLLALVALGIGFRSWSAVWTAVGGGIWSMGVVFGGVALAGWTLNVLTVAGPVLMAVIVICTVVHFAHYHSVPSHSHDVLPDEHEHEPIDPQQPRPGEGPSHFLRWVAMPCLGASLTTGFGFLMLAFNQLVPARELGFELFAGSVLAFGGAFGMWLVLPRFRASHGRWLSAERLERFEHHVVGSPWTTALLMCGLLVFLVVSATRVRLDADPFSFFQKDSRTAIALDHFAERKFGHYLLDAVLVPWEKPADTQSRATALAEHRRLALDYEARLAGRPEVRNVVSTAAMQAKIDRWDQLAGEALAAGRFGEAAGYVGRSTAFRQIFNNWLVDRSGKDAFRVTFMVYDTGEGFRPLMNAARQAVPAKEFDVFFSGTAASVAVLSEQLLGGTTISLLVAACAMALVCAFLFRSLRLTAIAFLPNSLPVLVVFGVMGLFGIPLNCGSAMVMSIALGISLNDTVHFVMHYRGRRREGAELREALVGTFGEVGRPIVVTSLVNCVGFGILALSDFLPMAHFGLMACVAMIAALVGDLVLLPNLLKLFDNGAYVPVTQPAKLETEPTLAS